MSFDALKQAIGNMISLPNGKVTKDIHFRLLASFVGDCGQYRACMLQDDEDIMTKSPSSHAWSYILPLQTYPCKHVHIHHQFLPSLWILRVWMNTSMKQWTMNRVLKKNPPNYLITMYIISWFIVFTCVAHCCITKCC